MSRSSNPTTNFEIMNPNSSEFIVSELAVGSGEQDIDPRLKTSY